MSDEGPRPTVLGKLLYFIGATVGGFIVGAVIGSRVAGLRRLFTPRKQMQAEVRLRAAQVFCDSRVQRTAGGNGLMIYYSLFEGMAVVMADEIVQHKLGQPAIDELSAQLNADLRKSSVKGSLMAAITAAGEQLALVMPRESADVNELSDRMIVLD